MTTEPKLRPDEQADYKRGFRAGYINAFPECPDRFDLEGASIAEKRGYRDGQECRAGEDGFVPKGPEFHRARTKACCNAVL